MHEEHGLSIWFFVGGMLTIYGIIILIANIPSFASATGNPHVVLEQLHAGLWWSIILFLVGILFLKLHWPGKHTILDDKDNSILSDGTEAEN
jgi:membrane protein implicated in regulation of membrane protease activity